MEPPPKVWVVFLAYGLAVLAILFASIFAVSLVHSVEPDLPLSEAVGGLRGLLAGGIASSSALVFTFVVATRGLTPARLRLIPGREGGRDLAMIMLGVLSLGQALDSLTVIAGLSERGTMEAIRRALTGTSGLELFSAVVVIGPLAGTAEEIFFRGYMQSLLRERWRPAVAVVVTSAAFGLLHLDWVHAPLAFALALYLGFVTELTGSALPAVAAHVVNNVVFTVLTALVGSVPGFWPNVAMLAATVTTFAGCVAWLTRSLSGRTDV